MLLQAKDVLFSVKIFIENKGMATKLEFHIMAGEEVAVIVLDCEACGQPIAVREREVKFSQPVECNACSHHRNLSYREFVCLSNSFASSLLHHASRKYHKGTYRLPTGR